MTTYLPSNSTGVFGSYKVQSSDSTTPKTAKRYIFGYGSIINTLSRNASIKTGDAYPCRICNLKRIWNRYESPNATTGKPEPNMGVIFTNNKNDTVNGVIYEVNDEMIDAYDKRELKWGYTRAILSNGTNHFNLYSQAFKKSSDDTSNDTSDAPSNNRLAMLSDNIKVNPDDIVYLYELPVLYEQVADDPTILSKSTPSPIANLKQSDPKKADETESKSNDSKGAESKSLGNLRANRQVYIDVCLTGCFEYGIDFAIEFIRSTVDWRNQWKLDRQEFTERHRRGVWKLNEEQCLLMDQFIAKHLNQLNRNCPRHLQTVLTNSDAKSLLQCEKSLLQIANQT